MKKTLTTAMLAFCLGIITTSVVDVRARVADWWYVRRMASASSAETRNRYTRKYLVRMLEYRDTLYDYVASTNTNLSLAGLYGMRLDSDLIYPVILIALADGNPSVRLSATETLRFRYGTVGQSAARMLQISMVNEMDEEVLRRKARALCDMTWGVFDWDEAWTSVQIREHAKEFANAIDGGVVPTTQ